MIDKFEHGGHWEEYREKAEGQLCDFSANINPLGLSPHVREAILSHIDDVVHYPDSRCQKLIEQIASFYGVEEKYLLAGNGAVELIYLLCAVLKPRRALIVSPAFSEYERALNASGSAYDYLYLKQANNFAPQLQEIIIGLKGHDLIFIGNPNNPTGSVYSLQELTLIVEHAEANGCFVAIDESFMDFVSDFKAHTALSLLEKSHNLIVLHSLTKFFALPGLRLGFAACSDEEVRRRMLLHKDPWSVNNLAQAAGCAALADFRYIKKSRNYLKSEKQYLYEELSAIDGLLVLEPSVNFILFNCQKLGFTAAQLSEKLLKEGFLIRDCSNYPGLDEYWARIAVRTRQENESFLEAIENCHK